MQATGIATINERLALVRRLRDRLADDANAIDALQAPSSGRVFGDAL
jgi:hypothetical protein